MEQNSVNGRSGVKILSAKVILHFAIEKRLYAKRKDRFTRFAHEALCRAFFYDKPGFIRRVAATRQFPDDIRGLIEGDVCKNLVRSLRQIPIQKVGAN
jgi:hypothetical protein